MAANLGLFLGGKQSLGDPPPPPPPCIIYIVPGFKVVVQTPLWVELNPAGTGTPVYCLASKHHENCNYLWQCLTDPTEVFLASPVAYVVMPGTYKCEVRYGETVIFSHQVKTCSGEQQIEYDPK